MALLDGVPFVKSQIISPSTGVSVSPGSPPVSPPPVSPLEAFSSSKMPISDDL